MLTDNELREYYHTLRDSGRHYLASVLRDHPELAPFTQYQEIIIELAKDNPHIHQAISLWLSKTVTWEQAQGMMVIGLHATNKQFQELLEYHLRYSQPAPIIFNKPQPTSDKFDSNTDKALNFYLRGLSEAEKEELRFKEI